jgi:hypothetical protein
VSSAVKIHLVAHAARAAAYLRPAAGTLDTGVKSTVRSPVI